MFFHQVRHDFRIRLCSKLVAFFLQLFLKLEVVFDNSVVHDDNLSGTVAVRMCIFFSGAAVSGPAGVADAVGAFERRLSDDFFQVAKFSRSAADLQFAGTVHDGDTRGIIAAVLEFAEAFNDHGYDFLRPDIAYNSAHKRRSPVTVGSSVTRPANCRKEFAPAGRRENYGCGTSIVAVRAPTICMLLK